jgi:hypothetical protein
MFGETKICFGDVFIIHSLHSYETICKFSIIYLFSLQYLLAQKTAYALLL